MKRLLLSLLLLQVVSSVAQVADNFSDGDFTVNPVWTGSSENHDFVVINEALRSNSTIANSNFYLSTPSTLALEAKWELQVSLQFNPSGANYVDIYLMSDKADLRSAQINGYFVRLGNSDDEISLYRRSGSSASSVRLIDGINGALNRAASMLKITIERDSSGKFTLIRELNGQAAVTEGTVTDTNHKFSQYFGLLIQQSTASFHLKHFFDDIRIERTSIDNSPPVIQTVTVIEPKILKVQFNEAVDSASSLNPANYLLLPYDANVIGVTGDSDPSLRKIELDSVLAEGDFELHVQNIADRAGNVIQGVLIHRFSFASPYTPQFRDITINEIFADPSPPADLPPAEFAELRNNTTKRIQLEGWKFGDEVSNPTLGNIFIEPGAFLILCARSDTMEFKRFGPTLGLSPWPSLNNAGEKLKLVSQSGLLIDSVRYSDSWYRNTTKKQGGWSLEQIDPTSECNDATNWAVARGTAGGSPGRENSVFDPLWKQRELRIDSLRLVDTTLELSLNKVVQTDSLSDTNFILAPGNIRITKVQADQSAQKLIISLHDKLPAGSAFTLQFTTLPDCLEQVKMTPPFSFNTPLPPAPVVPRTDTATIVLNEFLADPSPEIGLPLSEFVEIYNPGRDTVDLAEWTLGDGTTRSVLGKQLIMPGEYLILCPTTDTISYSKFGRVAGISPWPSLNNTSDIIVLKSHTGRTVDSISYSDTWYKDKLKKSGGWTLERIIGSSASCAGLYNWTTSVNEKGGTPGGRNSRMALYPPRIDTITAINNNVLRLWLNRFPDTLTVKRENFILGESEVAEVNLDESLLQIDLKLKIPFEEGKEYVVSAGGLTDCEGRVFTGNFSVIPMPMVPEQNYPVVINEIFADPTPSVGLPPAEFVELHNLSDQPVKLAGLNYGDNDYIETFTDGQIAANGYLILCALRDTAYFSEYGPVKGLKRWPALSDDGDILYLRNNKGKALQTISWSGSWYRNNLKKNGGFSLEMIDPASFCDGPQNWMASIAPQGGSPGKENSVYKLHSNLPLRVDSVALIDSTTVILFLNKAVDGTNITINGYYSVNNGAGSPDTVLLNQNFDQITLRFVNGLAKGLNYRIDVSFLKDCQGSAIDVAGSANEFFIPNNISQGDILITEILFNPRPGGSDFLEIYNAADGPRDLRQLRAGNSLTDSSNLARPLVKYPLLIQPGTYVAITTNADNIRMEYPAYANRNMLEAGSLPSLPDDKGSVVLLSGGKVIDRLNYSDKMHFQLLRNTEGVSLERSNLKMDASMPGNLRSATAASGFATPGAPNSQQSEISNAPGIVLQSKTFSPDNDGFEDLLEVSYSMDMPGLVANAQIFSMAGKLVRNLLRSVTLNQNGMMVWDGLDEQGNLVPIGIYILNLELFSESGVVRKYRKSFALAARL